MTQAGTGTGTVTSSPAGINCGTHLQRQLRQRHVGDAHGHARERLDVRGLERRVYRHGKLHIGDESGARSHRHVQHQWRHGWTCANPVTFTGNTGNFNTTGAACYRTNATINGWGCYNFDGRTLTVGGEARTCGQMPLTRAADGYYYFAASAGQFPWAGLFTW